MLQATNIINEVREQTLRVSEAEYYINDYDSANHLTDFLKEAFQGIVNHLRNVVRSFEEITWIELSRSPEKNDDASNAFMKLGIDEIYANLFEAKRGLKKLRPDGFHIYNRSANAYNHLERATEELENIFQDSIEPFVNLRSTVFNPDLSLIESCDNDAEIKEKHLQALQESLRAVLGLQTSPSNDISKKYTKALLRYSQDLTNEAYLTFLNYQDLSSVPNMVMLKNYKHFNELLQRYNGIVAQLDKEKTLYVPGLCKLISNHGEEYKTWQNRMIEQITNLESKPEYIVDLIDLILLVDRISNYDAQAFHDMIRKPDASSMLTDLL